MESQFLPEVENVLRTAGWYPGRKVDAATVKRWNNLRPLFPAAQEALEEFGNLYFLNSPYIVWRVRYPFGIEPVEALWYFGPNEEIDEYEIDFGCRVYPIGFDGNMRQDGKIEIISGSHLFLIEERGRVFYMGYAALLVGDTIQTALSNLILGNKSVPWDLEKDAPKEN